MIFDRNSQSNGSLIQHPDKLVLGDDILQQHSIWNWELQFYTMHIQNRALHQGIFLQIIATPPPVRKSERSFRNNV